MPKIAILPEILSNKIAAGEVVERPASVVKELIENALDADSRRLVIDIQNGGRSLIQVCDDGVGMIRDDALLSIERYATSKIHTDEDLFAIRTLGFRGEALPSIAAVSQFTLTTRPASQDTATRIFMTGGRLTEVSEVGAPVGTVMQVKRLFFNTPARRKFLKSVGTEMSHIGDTVARIALAWPQTAFLLNHDGRVVKRWPAADNPVNRVADVLGKGTQNRLLPVSLQNPAAAVSGWVGLPEINRNTSRAVYIYVNGRYVQDRMIRHALMEGFRGRLMKGKFPVAVLFVEVPFDSVDVNVHPTKHEVRFARPHDIHGSVQAAVLQAFTAYWKQAPKAPTAFTPDTFTPKPPLDFTPDRPRRIGEANAPYKNFPGSFRHRSVGGPFGQAARKAESQQTAPVTPAEQPPLWEKKRFSDLTFIGQFDNTYLLCESADGMVIIDQHAAHERIYFEQLKKQAASKRMASQRLLAPETVEFGFREAEILQHLIPELAAYGLEIEPFGGNTFVISAVPVILADREIAPLLRSLTENTATVGLSSDMEQAVEACLISIACHAVIRARQKLNTTEIAALLHQLDACQNPGNCPHGRPTYVEWPRSVIEKAFGRIV